MSQPTKVHYARKRSRDDENNERLKQQKTETTDTIDDGDGELGSPIQTKLTGLNDDCLEKIFIHLDFDDLLNIAHTNKELKTGADLAFASKFGKKQFDFIISMYRRNGILDTSQELIYIRDLKTALYLLRCYGHLNLNVIIMHNKPFCEATVELLRYINEYCAKSLKNITFEDFPKYLLESTLVKPFPKIENVHLYRCVLGKKASKINTWFPAMRSLTLNGSQLKDCAAIETHFPQMEEFALICMDRLIRPENVTAIFQSNPQLQRLSCDQEHLEGASQYLPVLENLTIRCHHDISNNGAGIHFNSVKRLTWPSATFRRIVNVTFGQLEEVEVCLMENETTSNTVDFFKKHQSIRKLKLVALKDQSKENVIEIVTHLPLIKDFTYFGNPFSAGETIRFLVKFNSLNHFVFNIVNPAEFQHLKEILGGEWTASNLSRYCVDLKRKT